MKFFALALLLSSFSWGQTPFQASINALTTEVDESAGAASFQITLDRPPINETVLLHLEVSGITATAGEDFVPTTQIVSFSPGEIIKIVDVAIIDDKVDEVPREIFHAIITPVSDNVLPIKPIEQVEILDDEEVFYMNGATVNEPDAGESAVVKLKLTRAFPSPRPVRVEMETVVGSAWKTEDYIHTWGQVEFAPDQMEANFEVKIVGDNIPELEEYFKIQVKGVDQEITLKDPDIQVNILDDDGALAVHFYSILRDPNDPEGMVQIYDSEPVLLETVEENGETYYRSQAVAPNFRAFIPGVGDRPDRDGAFTVHRLKGLETGNPNLHYSIGPPQLQCKLMFYWMVCPWLSMHIYLHSHEIHPDNNQLPGQHFVAERFDIVSEQNNDTVALARQTFVGTTEGLEEKTWITVMRVPEP